MNKQRRKLLSKTIRLLERLKDISSLTDAKILINLAHSNVLDCAEDEQFALDSRPESLMFSQTTSDMEENVADLEDAVDQLDSIAVDLTEAEVFDYSIIELEVNEIIDHITEAIER